MKIIKAAGYIGSLNIDTITCSSLEEKRSIVLEFFKSNNKSSEIISNIIAYYISEESNERIGYIEEHYINSKSTDYLYTSYIF